MPKSNLPVVCIANAPWNYLTQRAEHLLTRYARAAPVLFVEPPLNPGYRVLGSYLRPQVSQIQDNLRSLSPVKALPKDRLIRPLRSANNALTRKMIDHMVTRLGLGDHILWCYRYDSLSFGNTSRSKLILYDCVDDWPSFWESRPEVAAIESNLVSSCDIVITTAERLYEAKKRQNAHTYLVRNGVDFAHFNMAAEKVSPPSLMEDIHHPVIGFSGSVYRWVDLHLIAQAAKRKPDWSFVFVGPVGGQVQVPDMPNVHLLGRVPYDTLPKYLASFDVCILPFVHSDVTDSTNPVKMYEYLATGKPIVSTGIPEVKKLSNLIYIAEGVEDFVRSIEIALREDSAERRRIRQAAAMENSWDVRMERIMHIINERRDELGV